jgi:hypothetical protein
MPCQYCKLPGHTLTQCNADINVYLGQITRIIDSVPFAMRHQFQALNTYKKPLLSLICVRLGYCASVTSLRKTLLIDNIIEHYFQPRLQLAANLGEVYANARLQIFEAFRDLQMWNIDNKPDLCLFRNMALQLLDRYHTVAFGISYTDSLRAVQQIPVSIRFMALLNFPPQAFVQLLQREREEQSNAHLKKLDFHIKTDNSLEEAKECFICSEERPHAKLGCSHEYCIDCLFGTAKVRTKSFISCAVCRAEIEEVKVGTADTKTGLLQRLSEV